MSEFKKYRRTNIAEMKEYITGMDMSRVFISAADLENGSPKSGDMIARNPKDHTEQWLVAKEYFEENFEEVESSTMEDCIEEALGEIFCGSTDIEDYRILMQAADQGMEADEIHVLESMIPSEKYEDWTCPDLLEEITDRANALFAAYNS